MTVLTRDIAEKFASLALAHVAREYPNKLDHVMSSDADVLGPRALHPIFFGSFDWHSCVHGYWLLARLVRRYPDLRAAPAIMQLYAQNVTAEAVAAEVAYLDRPGARVFERPYGWGWLLTLQAELERHKDGPIRLAAIEMRPLARAFARRFKAFLPIATYPVRTGVHTSTAFAMRMAADYAEAFDTVLLDLMRGKTQAWYWNDMDCQAWEPSQDDFLSPALIEAECMRRLLPSALFHGWFMAFLPGVGLGEPETLFTPARVSDRTDGKIAHLDGLNFSRAWCWRSIAGTLGDPLLAKLLRETADLHIAASLQHVAGDYMGEHWLATFALLALEAG